MAIEEDENMMKKWTSLLLVLLMIFTSVAVAEEMEVVEEAVVAGALTISVLDKDGNAYAGANVTVKDAARETIAEFVVGEEPYVVEELLEGFYTIKAVEPENGYATVENIYFDADRELEMVIRTLQAGSKAAVGSVTRMSGAFFTDMWGNNTSDIDVRTLVHGHSTIAWTNDRQYSIDETVVSSIEVEYDEDGNKTYKFELNPDLAFSDGTKITAADYVFSVLLQSAKETAALGAHTLAYSHLLGYADFASGAQNYFAGVRMTGLRQFEVTIAAEYLPYFYELTYVNITPYPMHVIAPGCEILDDGEGAYIEGDFTVEALAKTIMDPEAGYLSYPTVSSGAYMLTSYDAENAKATFKVNPYYLGNYEGIKPIIESLELYETKYDSALAQIEDGTLDVVNKLSNGDVIDAGMALFAEEKIGAVNYLRTGYGFLAYACEEDVTSSLKVRQAMAMCMDRDAMIDDYLKTYGMGVYSYYGLGQWMAQPYASTMQDEVTVYPFDAAAAVELLEQDGWTLNAEGGKYVQEEGAVRYKKTKDGELMPLAIRFAQLKDNDAAKWVVENYAPVLEAIGFSFEVTEVAFNELLTHYYRQTDRTYNLMYLATNFAIVFDPYYTFNTADVYQGELNTSGIVDEKLMKLAEELRQTDPGDEETFTARWLELMQRFSDVLPTLPIYSNIYYDFFDTTLMNYAPNAHWSWPSAILYAYFAE